MEGKNSSEGRSPYQIANRVKQLIIQNLLLFLSMNVFITSQVLGATLQQNQTTIEQTTINQTTLFPFPIQHASMFINLAAIVPTVTTTRVLASTVTAEERRQHVIWFAESHTDWGFRYSMGNSSLDDGFDCSGFVRYVLNYFDFKTGRSSSEQFKDGTQIPVALARSGDLVFFGTKNSVSHVAMVISNDEKGLVVVHSTCSKGIVKENITESAYWKSKLKDKAVNIIGF